MVTYKRYRFIDPDDFAYEAYYKPRMCDHTQSQLGYNEVVRVVPSGAGWGCKSGVDGPTLCRLEDTGNGVNVDLEGKAFFLEYYELGNLWRALNVLKENDDWEGEGTYVQEEVVAMEEELVAFYTGQADD